MKRTRADAAALLVILAALLWRGVPTLLSPAPPAEDAAILMRYVEHVAAGHGMVWNPGEPPVDGATDFLVTAAAAGLVRAGLPLEAAVRGLAAAAHALTVLLLYAAARKLHGAPVPLALVCALFLAWGPGFRYAEMYFATPVFALLATVTWALAYHLRTAPKSLGGSLLFALAALLTGLTRPEGVFLALFLLAAVVAWAGRPAWKPVVVFGTVFAVLGGAFFLWRWHYFGHPLPTPFYKKGGGALHWGSLAASVEGVARLCLPFLLAAPLALRSRDARRRLVFALIPIGGFTLLWVLLSNEMNILYRFQFVLTPLVLLAVPDWVAGLGADFRLPTVDRLPARRAAVACLAATALAGLGIEAAVYRPRPALRDGRYDAARLLAGLSPRATLATSEAGLLPLYSRWRAVDTWGLNDFEIAHRGLTPERLEREQPAVIVFHANLSPMVPGPLGGDAWSRMVKTLVGYGARHGYIVAAVYGYTPFDTHTYLVRPDLPETRRIVDGLRGLDYHWPDGQPCINYALWRTAAAPR